MYQAYGFVMSLQEVHMQRDAVSEEQTRLQHLGYMRSTSLLQQISRIFIAFIYLCKIRLKRGFNRSSFVIYGRRERYVVN